MALDLCFSLVTFIEEPCGFMVCDLIGCKSLLLSSKSSCTLKVSNCFGVVEPMGVVAPLLNALDLCVMGVLGRVCCVSDFGLGRIII
jgi:hypothetical protein